jgi:two-component system LytT family response regulator
VSKRVLIVDDEKLARDRISRFLTELGYNFEISEADSGVAALERIGSAAPDILFLDIQMPGLNGLEVLQQIESRPFKVIFQTAFDEYAIQAFDENACDYLLKPYTKDRFKTAVEKSLSSIQQDQRLDDLEKEFRKRDGYLNRISVRRGDKIRILDVDDIHCFLSQDHYTCIFTADSEYLSDLSLTHLIERLDPDKFIRSHRNNIVNLSKIEKIGTGPNMTVRLLCGQELPVSRQNRLGVTGKLRNR